MNWTLLLISSPLIIAVIVLRMHYEKYLPFDTGTKRWANMHYKGSGTAFIASLIIFIYFNFFSHFDTMHNAERKLIGYLIFFISLSVSAFLTPSPETRPNWSPSNWPNGIAKFIAITFLIANIIGGLYMIFMATLPSGNIEKVMEIAGMALSLLILIGVAAALLLSIQLYLVACLNFGLTATAMGLYTIGLDYYDHGTPDYFTAFTSYLNIFEIVLEKTTFNEEFTIMGLKISQLLTIFLGVLSLAAAVARIYEGFSKNTHSDNGDISNIDL